MSLVTSVTLPVVTFINMEESYLRGCKTWTLGLALPNAANETGV